MGKSKPPTLAQTLQFHSLWDIGCLACRLFGTGWVAPEQDHRNTGDLAGNKRTAGGHDDTLPFCSWHHRGIPPEGWTAKRCEREMGPSKHLSKRRFFATFGTIDELYVIRDQLLGKRHG